MDTPTTEYGLRQQALGENVDTWGDDKLNQVIRAIAQMIGKMKPLVLTSDYTLTTTDYVTTADNKNAGFVFTGPSLVVTTAVTFPSSYWRYLVINNTPVSLACKTFAGATVTVPAGTIAALYGDSVDVKSAAPTYINAGLTVAGQISGVVAATGGTQAVNLTQMAAAIAASVPLGTAGTFLNSLSDTTRGFFVDKFEVAGSLEMETINPGANEKTRVSFTFDEGNQVLLGGVLSV